MDLKVKNGKRQIKLDAAERRAMAKAKALCQELQSLTENSDSKTVRDAAYNAKVGLGVLLEELSPAETNGKADVIPEITASDVKKAMQRDVPA